MTIDNIPLTASLCTNLFQDKLVLPPNSLADKKSSGTSESTEQTGSTAEIIHLGLNGQKILFLVHSPNVKYLPDDEMDMLAKLLGACQLSMADIALINYQPASELTYTDFVNRLQSEKLLIFGVTPQTLGLPFNIPHFQIQTYENKTFLFAPAMHSFLKDIDLKKSLWASLQKLFSL